MSRYIDAEKLKRSIEAQCRVLRAIGIDELTEMTDVLSAGFYQEIENAPTADVQEVRHGRWTYDGEMNTGIYAICSVCKESVYQAGEWRYCPNCGAKMDEVEE